MDEHKHRISDSDKMELSNEAAFPYEFSDCGPIRGLTKREYFAGLAMQGLLNKGDWGEGAAEQREHFRAYMAKLAVKNADALLKELNK